jgi:hypothetical protein
VFFASGEGEEDGEDGGGEVVFHASQSISIADVSAMDIYVCATYSRPGAKAPIPKAILFVRLKPYA